MNHTSTLIAHVSPGVYSILLAFMAACAMTLIALITGWVLAVRPTTRAIGRRILVVGGVFAALEVALVLLGIVLSK